MKHIKYFASQANSILSNLFTSITSIAKRCFTTQRYFISKQLCPDWILDWLAPKRCAGCNITVEKNELFCHDCTQTLPYYDDSCRACGQAYSQPISNHGATATHCGRCLNSPQPFDSVFCPFLYEKPLSAAIQKLKYAERPDFAALLARLFANEIIASGIPLPECLISVPMHPARLEQRGYNQSALLCRHLGELLDIDIELHSLAKEKNAPPQVSLKLPARKTAIRGSFKAQKPLPYKSVAIVDDVFTTGATTAELTRVLLRNGVQQVQVWALTHTL